MKVGVVDYGMGNVFSVRHALARVGTEPVDVLAPADLSGLGGLVIPGVGAMPDAMAALRRQGLVEAIRDAAADGLPILGICLGFQLLMETGTEFGDHDGLGLMPGRVVPLPRGERGERLPVPNVRWLPLDVKQSAVGDTPFETLSTGDELYFVHSFYVEPGEGLPVVARARFGDLPFCAAASRGRVHGCQFHPERSGPTGLAILRRFATLLRGASTHPSNPDL